MLKLIQGHESSSYPLEMEQMFKLRAKVFKERLGWDVVVKDGKEIDKFDELDPLYILSISDDGNVVGCLRLLQTTGPNMLSDVFNELLPEGTDIRSPLIWESTRFCVDNDGKKQVSEKGVCEITSELLCGMTELGMKAGLSHIVSVFDVFMERILKRAGCTPDRIGKPKRIGKTITLAALFELNDELLSNLRSINDTPYPLIEEKYLNRINIAA